MKAVDGDEELVRHQIVAASLEIVGAQGFGTSLAHIAEAAGVTTEVLLQHFGTREQLNTATIGELFDRYDYSFDNAPVPGDDLSAWIDALCAYVHKENLEVFGQGFWDVALSVHKLTGGLVDFASERRWLRGRWSRVFAEQAWRAAGRNGEPPQVLVEAFDVHLTAFATNAFLAIGYSLDEVATTSAGLLKAVLAGALK